MIEQEIIQISLLGSATVILYIIYLIIKIIYGKKKELNGIDKAILLELKTQNENHLKTMEIGINEGFNRVVAAIKEMHIDIAGKLGEIKGKLR